MSQNLWKIKPLIAVNLFAITLFVSWLYEPMSSFWYSVDSGAFWAFNNSLLWGETWQTIWGVANNRAFDIVAAVGIVIPFFYYGYKQENWKLSKTFSILILAGLVVVITTSLGKEIPIERESPTRHFQDSVKLTELVSFKTKDSSGDSFPGDHGATLVIFAGFAFFYLSLSYGFLVASLATFFAFPRVMVGAHWVSDELVGALSIGLIMLSFMFFTPLHNFLLTKIEFVIETIVKKVKR